MEQIWKEVKLRGERGVVRETALIDTGTPRVILPRRVAERVGTIPTGRTGVLNIRGQKLRMQIHMADVEIITGGCRAMVEALVPDDPSARIPLMIGSRFLQKTGAAIVYRGKHPVLCTKGDITEDSWNGEFVPDQPRATRARSSRARR